MTNYLDNIMLLTDSYKLSHAKQYPPGTEKVYSYFESRAGAKFDKTLFFGLQYVIKRHLQGRVVTQEKIDFARQFAKEHFGSDIFNAAGWQHILDEHDGFLPVVIRAVPEGSLVETGNVLMTIENTDPKCYWLPNYLETLLVQVWYPSTVATVSHHVKQLIKQGLEVSGDPAGLPFKLHDFGFRGATVAEAAGIGGLGHLVNFMGTDTLAAILCGQHFYDAGMIGFSIPASEHSTITSWGQDGELAAFRNMLEQYPTGLVACVSDSFDINAACSEIWGELLRDEVLSRDGVLVVRPDSGDIVPMVLNVLERLGEKFGTYVNDKGYRVLDDHVRVIQGDGCTPETVQNVIQEMLKKGWSLDNVAFGMGAGLLQKVNRDTQRFAFKASSIVVDGKHRDVFKAPKSDPTKNSKRGRMVLVRDVDNNYRTLAMSGNEYGLPFHRDELVDVFLNGQLTYRQNFDEIRERSNKKS